MTTHGRRRPAEAGNARPQRWRAEYYEDGRGRSPFARWFERDLTSYEQAVLAAAVKQVLEVVGIDICSSEWGKSLGDGLYEFRVRQSLHAIRTYGQSPTPLARPGEDRAVLLRAFVTFYGDRVVLLLHGLNKGRGPSTRKQQKEIAKARRLLKDWRRQR